MERRTALKLKAQIEVEDPQVQVAGICTYTGRNGRVESRSLPCIDRRTGIPFIVYSPEDWEERKRAAQTI